MAVTCIVAASAANAPPDEIPAVQYWDLPTHSRIACLKFNAIGERRTYPIVFLHGGPGAYLVTLEPTTRVLSQLRQDGFDVYAYDQVDGGLSQRLSDIAEYTVARHVADLEAIRRESTRFQALVNRSDLEQAMEPLASDPAGALRAFPHAEGDRPFDEVTNRFYLPHLDCAHSKFDVTSKGYGFWANRMTSRDLDLSQDPAPVLRHSRVCALILRGECEYMKRAVAEQYRDTFPDSDLVDLPGAGHMIYWDQPAAFLATVRSFLR